MQIVVADDDLGERLVLKTVLSRLNYEVEATEDGAAALEALERGNASILLTDITMPEMDGLELVRRLRETDLGRYIYVIVFTGLGAHEASMRGLEAVVRFQDASRHFHRDDIGIVEAVVQEPKPGRAGANHRTGRWPHIIASFATQTFPSEAS